MSVINLCLSFGLSLYSHTVMTGYNVRFKYPFIINFLFYFRWFFESLFNPVASIIIVVSVVSLSHNNTIETTDRPDSFNEQTFNKQQIRCKVDAIKSEIKLNVRTQPKIRTNEMKFRWFLSTLFWQSESIWIMLTFFYSFVFGCLLSVESVACSCSTYRN